MDAKPKCGTCRRGILFPTSTTVYRCHKCQTIICSRPNEQAKINCSGCGGEFIVPIKTTAYRCSICQAVTTTSGHGQWSSDSPVPGQKLKLGSILFKHNRPDKSHQLSSSSTGSFTLSTRCKKRAVLCGVTYKKRRYKLKGTINDVMNMREMLVKIFDFPKESIRILTEEEKDQRLVPTKKNILESLKWLVDGCRPGDSLVFYFSGHGLQQPDLKEDELDGFDETLCPVDFVREGMIVDNELNSILVWPLKNGVTLHAIVDACHSGTILDLAYVYKLENHEWEDNKPPAKVPMRKHTSGGLAISFSACEDNQIAVDTTAFRKGMHGVMTYLFIKAIKENPDITYGGILEKVREGIAVVNQKSCNPRIFHRRHRHYISQDTILSSSEKFDVFKRTFAL
ncbi:metacaspase-1-like isoform X1 [Neltuma alba]|uniref:metacaspase-1-like isoform X1 n=1 Tax=Neltuma alba TaxID=207710 RepID=UPI0010A32C71|nr:metacaspase-1-like isoform X1 [Prosopis alba]XP_028753207.1 metacaspase-1-like isoform X1 [Prosopis alba]XP_028753208.1 metacaspase-1-like isoform X1 [Prosopis alba]